MRTSPYTKNKTARDPKEGLKLLAAKSEELAEGIHSPVNTRCASRGLCRDTVG